MSTTQVETKDPFPYRVGKVRLAFPGWLNREHTVYDPREEYEDVD